MTTFFGGIPGFPNSPLPYLVVIKDSEEVEDDELDDEDEDDEELANRLKSK